MAGNEVIITVKGVDKASGVIGGVEQKAGGLKGTLGKVGTMAAGFLAANVISAGFQAFNSFITGSIGLARGFNETLSKSTTIWGDNAASVEAWSKTSSTALGMSQGDALDAAAAYGNFWKQLGLTTDESEKLSQASVQLDADIGSFFDIPVEEVSQARMAAYRGEYDAMQRYVPTINAASVEQKALAMTGKATTQELTAQDKALAANELMLEGTGDAKGDFARTSDSAANSLKIENAKMEDLQVSAGQYLVPVMKELTKLKTKLARVLVEQVIPAVATIVGFFKEHKTTTAVLVVAIGTLTAGLVAVKVATMSHTAAMLLAKQAKIAWAIATKAATAAQWLLNAAMSANPIALVVLAIAAITAGLIYFFTQTETGQKIITTAWDTIKSVFETVFNWVRDNWPLLLAILTGPFGLAVLAVITKKDEILGIITGLWTSVKSAATGAGTAVADAFAGVFALAKTTVATKIGEILEAVKGLWKDIKGTASDFLGAGLAIGTGIYDGFRGGINSVIGLINKFLDSIGWDAKKVMGETVVPGFNPFGPKTIPTLATGGRVTRTGLAEVHRGETFSGVGRPGGLTVSVYAQGSILSERDVTRIIADAIRVGGFRGLVAT